MWNTCYRKHTCTDRGKNIRNHKKKQGFHRKGQGDQRRTSDDLRQRMQNRGIGIGSSPIGNEGFAHPSARPRRSKMYYTNFVGYYILYYVIYYTINYIIHYIILNIILYIILFIIL